MGSVLRYLLAGLALSGVWLLIALAAIPGGMAQVEEFSLYGWPALGLLFLVPLALIWGALWLVRLQRRVTRLQQRVFDYGSGPVLGPSYAQQQRPPGRSHEVAEAAFAEAWAEDPLEVPDPRQGTDLRQDPYSQQGDETGAGARAPRRVAFSELAPLPADPETAHAERRAADRVPQAGPGRPLQGQYGEGAAAVDRRPRAPAAPVVAGRPDGERAQPRRAWLPEPDSDEADTAPETLPHAMEPHRPPRAAPDAPRLEALTPTYRNPSEIPAKALSAEQFAQYEARSERELNAIAMDLASIVSAPADYDRALDALNGGAGEAFFQLLARDFQAAHPARLGQQLATVGGDGALQAYLEKYEQLLVVAYRSDPGGRTVKRLVDSPMGRLHQAIESFRQAAPGS